MINEPPSGQSPSMKMIHSAAHFLSDDDPLMKHEKLTQPVGAQAAWHKHMTGSSDPNDCLADEPWRRSEQMVLFVSTRGSYPLERELTVDYGDDYARDYVSGFHKADFSPLYEPEAIDASMPAKSTAPIAPY